MAREKLKSSSEKQLMQAQMRMLQAQIELHFCSTRWPTSRA